MRIKLQLILLCILFAGLNAYAQPSWTPIGNSANYPALGSCIDPSDNIYTLEYTRSVGPASYRLIKKDINGAVIRTINIPGIFDFGSSGGALSLAHSTNHIAFGNNSVYLTGRSILSGEILEIDANLGSVSSIATIVENNCMVQTNSITVKNNEIFVTGGASLLSGSSGSISFGSYTLPINATTGFVAKYSKTTNSWVWVSQITGTGVGRGPLDLEIDRSGNIYVMGEFPYSASTNTSITLFDRGTPYTLTGRNSSFVFRMNPLGNYDPTWGFKNSPSGSLGSGIYDIKLNNSEDALYYLDYEYLHKYDISGTLAWSYYLGVDIADQIATNCDRVYLSGLAGNKSPQMAMISALDESMGTLVWQTRVNSNYHDFDIAARSVLVDSKGDIHFIGSYFNRTNASASIIVGGNPIASVPGNENGSFVISAEDISKTCCTPLPIALSDRTDCYKDGLGFIDIYSQLGGAPLSQLSIKWFFNGVQTSSTSPFVFLDGGNGGGVPTPGVYSVEVLFPQCKTPVTASMRYTREDCSSGGDGDCEIIPDFEVNIVEDCFYSLQSAVVVPSHLTITGYLWDFGDGHTSTEENPEHYFSYGGPLTIRLTVFAKDQEGYCCSTDVMREVEIRDCSTKDCKIIPRLESEVLGNVVHLSDQSASSIYTRIVGTKWDINNGQFVSNSKDLLVQLPRGVHQVCMTVYAMNSQGECCEEIVCESFEIEDCLEVDRITVIGGNEGGEEKKHNGSTSNEHEEVILYPNPTSDILNIEVTAEGEEGELSSVIINNLNGQRIFETTDISTRTLSIDTSSWPSGMYICQILSNGKMISKEVIKY